MRCGNAGMLLCGQRIKPGIAQAARPVLGGVLGNLHPAGSGIVQKERHMTREAKELIDACESVICDRTEFGTYEQFNSRLYEYAVSTGKIIKIPFLEEQLAQL